MAQIEIKNLSFTYPKEKMPAVSNVSLKIEKGSYVVLCGKSGSGKSTLLRNLKPALRLFGKVEGKVLFENQELEQMEEQFQAQRIGFVMQSPEHQLVTDKVWHELAFGLENLGYEQNEIQVRVAEIAEYFGMTDWYDTSVDRLSGGQKQLLNLAAIMVMNPELLILDEPTAQLDPIAAERFLDMVKKINQDFGVTILLSEHRLNYVLPLADQVVIMEQGKVLYGGTLKEVLRQSLDQEFMKLMPDPSQIFYQVEKNKIQTSIKSEGNQEMSVSTKHEYTQEMPVSIKQGREWLEKKDLSKEKEIYKVREQEKFDARKKENDDAYKKELGQRIRKTELAVSCKNVWFRYERAGKDIIKDLNLQIKQGEIYAILGGNGTGKTTTMSLISRVNKPYRGRIKINGTTAYLPQDVQTLFCRDTVEKELREVPEDIITLMELEGLMKKHPYDLSGGQQQKLGMAKVLLSNADILLLDEPTKGIDGIYKEEMGKLLKALKTRGKTIIIVSHDIDFCGEYADRCGLFAMGNIVSEDLVRNFFRGNRFYTTTVRKMTENVVDGVVNKEDLICFLTAESTM